MKIIEVARQQKDLLNEGIAYVTVWQEITRNGKRSWNTEDIFPDGGVQNDEPVFSDEQRARLAEIAALDADAVLLNGCVHSWIGSTDEPLNATQIAEGIKKHYGMHHFLVSGYIVDGSDIDTQTATLTDGHGGEYSTESEHNQGTSEVVCLPESSMSADDMLEMITIELPVASAKEDILRSLIESKATLINAALGGDGFGELPLEFGDGKVSFPWLRFGTDGETVAAWSAFLAAAVRFSKKAKRVTAKDAAVENEKYAFRCFLLRLGFIGDEFNAARKVLLAKLEGDSAWR